MYSIFFKIRFLLVLTIIQLIISCSAKRIETFDHFITTRKAMLFDGEKEFRFLSYNVPTLNYVEDNMEFEQTNPYGLPTEFELRDVFKTLNQIGGNVVRAYTIPVRNEKFPKKAITYVEGPGQFNEQAFKSMDTMLALASEYKIRVIIPLVNNWEWMGGRPNYAKFRNRDKDDFWTDPELIADFKKTIEYVLNRTNSVTGIKYKNDKAIMAWESGNELQNPDYWAIDIAKFIKSIDKNHLFIDGFFAIHGDDNYKSVFVKEYSINEPAIDIISTHHYEPTSQKMITNLKKTVDMIGGKKPLLIGEFGFIGTSGMNQVLDYVINEKRIAGGLIWSLRRHNKKGGFYQHTEPFGGGLYRAYHWPGFSEGILYDETNTMRLFRKKSFEIMKKREPKIIAPDPPKILNFKDTPQFSWQGSAGASGYNIERSFSKKGPWKLIKYNIDDIDTPGFNLFSDQDVQIGKSYYYRMQAINEGGISKPSNIIGPIKVDFLTKVDYAKNLMLLEKHKGLKIKKGDYRSFKEAYSRINGNKGSEGVYVVPMEFKEFRLYSYESSKIPNISFLISENGIQYSKFDFEVNEYKSKEDNYNYLVPRKYVIKNAKFLANDSIKKIKYIKFMAGDNIDIVRAELTYQ